MAWGRVSAAGAAQRDSHLLLHFDGSNGGTTFTDSSFYNRTVTPTGNVNTSTARKKFGTASAYFDGNGDYLSSEGSFSFGTLPFTVDFWIYPTSVAADGDLFDTEFKGAAAARANAFATVLSTDRAIKIFHNSVFVITTTELCTLNAWNHVAIVRSGTTVTVYVNGVAGGNATISANLYKAGCLIGAHIDSGYGYYTGYMDELRVRVGDAVWTANFTPPSAPYTY